MRKTFLIFRTEEERTESLRNVSESLSLAMQLSGMEMPAEVFYGRLERRKSKIPDLHSNFNEAPTTITSGPQRTGFHTPPTKTIGFYWIGPATLVAINYYICFRS